jgi:CheY-specific phosphatase CheX
MIADLMATKLRHAAASVLEMMFMAPVLADQEFPPADVVGPILVGLEFKGEVNGTFTLAVSAETAEFLALSFMGMDAGEHLDRQPVIEVLGELANMLCGHVLGQLNYHDTFRLSTPIELALESFAPKGHTSQRTVHLEQGALSMQVAVEDDQSPN